jgi:hypothetical protein
MQRGLAIACVFVGFVFPAAAQDIEITLMASSRNQAACATGDKTFVKKWSVAESRSTAKVSGSTSVILKKGPDGVFAETARVANSTVVFTFVNNGPERTLKVVSRELGCVWQGTFIDPRRTG